MEMNDMPYLLLGALASVRDDSINTVDDMVKKGKKESEELVDSVGKVVKDTLDSLGIVTKSDIKSVEDRLAGLEKKLGTAKKPAKKKAAKKA